jgi:hypothetical protein
VKALYDNAFIDRQTRSILLDFVVYNSYMEVYLVLNLVCMFEPNGLIETDVRMYNVKRNYYGEPILYMRLFFEICFVLLLIFYFIMEVMELVE